MKQLYLDDIRIPEDPENWDIVRSYEEFVEYIFANGIPDFISFDHDLGTEKTGYDCAKFLGDYIMDTMPEGTRHDFILTTVHSQNPVGKDNIERFMHNLNWHIGGLG